MGYKLAGYDVVGVNEIDPKMAALYKQNHDPKYLFVEPIQDFVNRKKYPKELYNLDILDGSPPCSSFSVASVKRDKMWGKEKKFREGQSKQILDDLFFYFIDLAEKLKPKAIIAENVKGLTQKVAQKYMGQILHRIDKAGYYVDWRLLNASKMGVPQKRERVFFVAIRKDLYKGPLRGFIYGVPKIDLDFKCKTIKWGSVRLNTGTLEREMSEISCKLWKATKPGRDFSDACKLLRGKDGWFTYTRLSDSDTPLTLIASGGLFDSRDPRFLFREEFCSVSSFPQDYDFMDQKTHYVCGMSVPPLMMARVADAVGTQWLGREYDA